VYQVGYIYKTEVILNDYVYVDVYSAPSTVWQMRLLTAMPPNFANIIADVFVPDKCYPEQAYTCRTLPKYHGDVSVCHFAAISNARIWGEMERAVGNLNGVKPNERVVKCIWVKFIWEDVKWRQV